MAEIRAEGVSRGAVGQRREPRLPGTVQANKGGERRRKGTLFPLQLKKIASGGGWGRAGDKTAQHAERQRRGSALRFPIRISRRNAVNDSASHIRSDLFFLMPHKAIAYTPKRQD